MKDYMETIYLGQIVSVVCTGCLCKVNGIEELAQFCISNMPSIKKKILLYNPISLSKLLCNAFHLERLKNTIMHT